MINKCKEELRSRTLSLIMTCFLTFFGREERLEMGLHIWKLTRCFCKNFCSCTRLTSRVNTRKHIFAILTLIFAQFMYALFEKRAAHFAVLNRTKLRCLSNYFCTNTSDIFLIFKAWLFFILFLLKWHVLTSPWNSYTFSCINRYKMNSKWQYINNNT